MKNCTYFIGVYVRVQHSDPELIELEEKRQVATAVSKASEC